MRTLYGDHKRYEDTYFSAYKVHILLSYALLSLRSHYVVPETNALVFHTLCCQVITATQRYWQFKQEQWDVFGLLATLHVEPSCASLEDRVLSPELCYQLTTVCNLMFSLLRALAESKRPLYQMWCEHFSWMHHH